MAQVAREECYARLITGARAHVTLLLAQADSRCYARESRFSTPILLRCRVYADADEYRYAICDAPAADDD